MSKFKKSIAIDFDGVIHWYRDGWKDGEIYDEPFPQAIKSIKKLMEDYDVFIFTARDTKQVSEWMEKNGFNCHIPSEDRKFCPSREGILFVTNKKFPAHIYIDDRGYRFEDWWQTMKDIKKLI